jgi:hypothetical protein
VGQASAGEGGAPESQAKCDASQPRKITLDRKSPSGHRARYGARPSGFGGAGATNAIAPRSLTEAANIHGARAQTFEGPIVSSAIRTRNRSGKPDDIRP